MINIGRMKNAMTDLLDHFTHFPQTPYSVFFERIGVDETEACSSKDILIPKKKLDYFDKRLNPAQMDAVEFSMESKPFSLIHGINRFLF